MGFRGRTRENPFHMFSHRMKSPVLSLKEMLRERPKLQVLGGSKSNAQ